MRIILASSSPRRQELLKKVIKNFEVIPSNNNEKKIIGTSTKALVEGLSCAKAENIFIQEQDSDEDLIVIGADTIVELGKNLMGKPKDEEEAKEMLMNLSGKTSMLWDCRMQIPPA